MLRYYCYTIGGFWWKFSANNAARFYTRIEFNSDFNISVNSGILRMMTVLIVLVETESETGLLCRHDLTRRCKRDEGQLRTVARSHLVHHARATKDAVV